MGETLAGHFRFHPVALQMWSAANAMSMVHGYADHLFFVLHRPVVLAAGHVQLVELDLFVGDHFLVSILLEEMFMVRYELLSVRTAAAHSEEVMARARRIKPPRPHAEDRC